MSQTCVQKLYAAGAGTVDRLHPSLDYLRLLKGERIEGERTPGTRNAAGPPPLKEGKVDMASSVALIVVVSVVWATLHSLLASRLVKARVRERYGPQTSRWYRAAFVGVTVITLWPVVYLMLHLPSSLVYTVPGPWRWLMHAGQLLAVAAIVGSVHQVGGFRRFVGIEQWQGKVAQPDTLQIGQFYGCVRHPMFLSAMTLIWLTPTMTSTVLTGYVVATLYFVVATFLDENKLVATFSDAYHAYQQRVPRLIPRLGQCMRAWRGEQAADSSRADQQ